jgi:hypothetical protein
MKNNGCIPRRFLPTLGETTKSMKMKRLFVMLSVFALFALQSWGDSQPSRGTGKTKADTNADAMSIAPDGAGWKPGKPTYEHGGDIKLDGSGGFWVCIINWTR